MTLSPCRLVFEQDVIRPVGIERWIQVDQVNRFVANVVTQDGQVIAVIKGVHEG